MVAVSDGVGENAGLDVFVTVGILVFVLVGGGTGVFLGLLVGLGFLVGAATTLLLKELESESACTGNASMQANIKPTTNKKNILIFIL